MRSLFTACFAFLITCSVLAPVKGISAEPDDQSDPALVAPPINTNPGPEYADDTRMFQGIPGLERSKDGRLWALWYSGGITEGELNYVILVTSGDDGLVITALRGEKAVA